MCLKDKYSVLFGVQPKMTPKIRVRVVFELEEPPWRVEDTLAVSVVLNLKTLKTLPPKVQSRSRENRTNPSKTTDSKNVKLLFNKIEVNNQIEVNNR